MSTKVTLVTEPTVFVLASMQLEPEGLKDLVGWLAEYAPQCLDPEEAGALDFVRVFPHTGMRDKQQGVDLGRRLTDNELLVELSGRKCYNSFGKKAGRNTNAGYVANLFGSPGK